MLHDDEGEEANADANAAEVSKVVGPAAPSASTARIALPPRHGTTQQVARASASSACHTSIALDADGRACGVLSQHARRSLRTAPIGVLSNGGFRPARSAKICSEADTQPSSFGSTRCKEGGR